MVLYFQSPINKSGYRLQMKFDTETGKPEKGYFLFRYTPADPVELSKKQLEQLFEQVFEEWEKKQKENGKQ